MLSNKNHPWRTMGKWTFFPSEIQVHHGTSVVNFTVRADHEMYHAMWPTSIGNLKYFLSQRTPPYFAKWRSIVKIIMLLARDGEQNLSGWWAFVTLKSSFTACHFQKNKSQLESGREDSNGVSQTLENKLVSFGLSQLSVFYHLFNLFMFNEKHIIIY